MKTGLVVFIFFAFSFYSVAQTVLLEQDVNADTIKPVWGKNLSHYGHFFVSAGTYIPNESVNDNLFISSVLAFGYRYKRRVCNYYAVGLDLRLVFSSYNIKKDSSRNLPYSGFFNKENFNSNCLDLTLYNRFNFGKRGNAIGKFIDIGFSASSIFLVTQKTKFKNPVGENIKAKYDVSSFFYPLNYSLLCRIGKERWSVFCNYRLSPLFEKKFHYQELPQWSAGLEFGF